MKSIKFSFIFLFLLVLCSCSKKDYLKVIPADAALVASVNLGALSEKSDFANSALMGMVERMADGDMGELQEYKDNPMETGIDFTQPMYFFVIQDNMYGIVAKVDDKEDVEEFFDVLRKHDVVSRPVEKNGVMCGTMGTMNYAFNDDVLLMIDGNGASASTLVRMMKNEDECFMDTEAYGKMNDVDDKDIVVYYNLGYLPEDVQNEFKKNTLNGQLNMDDVELLSSIDFTEGSAVMKTKWWGKTATAQKTIDEMKDCLQKIDGDFLDDLPNDLFVWIGIGTNGEKALERLKSNAQTKEALFMLERGVDVEQMIRSIDGDVSIALSGISNMFFDLKMDISVKAKLKSSSFLEDVDDWKKSMVYYGMSMRDNGKNSYILTIDGDDLYWGVDDDELYFYMPKSYRQMRSDGGYSALNEYENDIKESNYFMYLDLQSLLGTNGFYSVMAQNFGIDLQGLKAIILKSSAHDEMVLQIDMEDDDENFLKQLLK